MPCCAESCAELLCSKLTICRESEFLFSDCISKLRSQVLWAAQIAEWVSSGHPVSGDAERDISFGFLLFYFQESKSQRVLSFTACFPSWGLGIWNPEDTAFILRQGLQTQVPRGARLLEWGLLGIGEPKPTSAHLLPGVARSCTFSKKSQKSGFYVKTGLFKSLPHFFKITLRISNSPQWLPSCNLDDFWRLLQQSWSAALCAACSPPFTQGTHPTSQMLL